MHIAARSCSLRAATVAAALFVGHPMVEESTVSVEDTMLVAIGLWHACSQPSAHQAM
jgi:hypothetical protein